MQIENIMELMNRNEELLPELKPWLAKYKSSLIGYSTYLNHPLVQEMFLMPGKCALINERFRQKTIMRDEALKVKDAHRYIWLHERPYRLEAFQTYLDNVKMTDTNYWHMVESIWIDSENIWQHKKTWLRVWNTKRKYKYRVMSQNERHLRDKLPQEIEVWRGCNRNPHDKQGLSWTLDRDRAIWFANRYNGIGLLISGVVAKMGIDAVLLGRGENEVVSNKVVIKSTETIKRAVEAKS